MTIVDIFNGDADGICALIQYRLAFPEITQLITGVKRDITLLDQVLNGSQGLIAEGDVINVFDLSMQKNKIALLRILSTGASVFYVDHHLSGDIPEHQELEAIIDTSPTICTSLLMDQYLKGIYKEWAIVAAFGDNMLASAKEAAAILSLSDTEVAQLKKLGISVNYNSYGSSVSDLHFPPDQLYQSMVAYRSPFDFINDTESVFQQLQHGYETDMAQTQNLKPEMSRFCKTSDNKIAVYILPDETWARRISGVFGNQLSNQYPDRAHALLTHHLEGGYIISVRAPQNNLMFAGELCSQFKTGGGRKGAAGINQLPENEVETFISLFEKTYSKAKKD